MQMWLAVQEYIRVGILLIEVQFSRKWVNGLQNKHQRYSFITR